MAEKAVLLSFRINDNQVMEGAETRYYDKVPMKFAGYDEARFQREGFRVVPPATVRKGAFIARNTVLMPSYVNIGALLMRALWSILGPPWVLARKSVKRPSIWWRWYWRRLGATASEPNHYRR